MGGADERFRAEGEKEERQEKTAAVAKRGQTEEWHEGNWGRKNGQAVPLTTRQKKKGTCSPHKRRRLSA